MIGFIIGFILGAVVMSIFASGNVSNLLDMNLKLTAWNQKLRHKLYGGNDV